MPLIVIHRYTPLDLWNNPNAIFVFGDNEAKEGYGGQAAVCRGEPNGFGIPTMVAPGVPYTDDDLDRVLPIIRAKSVELAVMLNEGKVVVWPADGIGTGIANLQENAPSILRKIHQMFEDLDIFRV